MLQRDGSIVTGAQERYTVVKDVGRRQSQFRLRNIENTQARQSMAADSLNFQGFTSENDVAVNGLLSLMNKKRKREMSTTFSPSKSHLPVSPVGSDTQAQATDTESLKSEMQDEVVTDLSTMQEKYQQELRRERQIRYRKKIEDHLKSTEEKTRELREEIVKLERRRRSTALSANENVWNVALEYFRIFHNGLHSRPQGGNQFEFLRSTMSSDMAFNTGRGIQAMIRSWKCISLWFQDVELEIEGMEKEAAGSLIADMTTRITITERTLRNVFPHLCSNKPEYVGLADKLLGQRIVMNGSIRFEWDPALRCVSRVQTHSDMLRPMVRLVGSLEKASQVFESSIISPDFQWRSTTN